MPPPGPNNAKKGRGPGMTLMVKSKDEERWDRDQEVPKFKSKVLKIFILDNKCVTGSPKWPRGPLVWRTHIIFKVLRH